MASETCAFQAGDESDDALMARAAVGERAAFATLVERHEVAVRRFCRTLVTDSAQAEDVAQDTFVSVWEARERYKAAGTFKSFLFTVARNRCFSVQRKQRWLSFFAPEAEATVPDDSGSQEAGLAANQHKRLLREALARVPLKFREPLTLRFLENMSYEDIAQIIGRTPSTARSRIFYGLKALAQQLPAEMTPWSL